jgi:hypothetical protein
VFLIIVSAILYILQVKHFFMYRDTWATVKSFYKLFGTELQRKLFTILMKYSAHTWIQLTKQRVDMVNNILKKKKIEFTTSVEASVAASIGIVCYAVAKYIQLQEQGLPICAFRYEDLLNDAKYSIEALFEYCHLPLDLVSKGLRAMAKDSQRNTLVSRTIPRYSTKGQMHEDQMKQILLDICTALNIPNTVGLINLHGTISNKTD